MRIALLADLAEPLGPTARRAAAALIWELAEGLHEACRDIGKLEVDVFARRGSETSLPTISIDPGELPARSGKPLDAHAASEAVFCQAVLLDLLAGYDLVHCLAPIVTPLQLLAARGVPIVQTRLTGDRHPAAAFPPRLIAAPLLHQVVLAPETGMGARRFIPPGVGLELWVPDPAPRDDFLLWLAGARRERRGQRRQAEEIAEAAGLPLVAETGDPRRLLPQARALLHLDTGAHPRETVWPLRALACSTAVAAWQGGALDSVLDRPEMGVTAPPGDNAALAAGLRALPDRARAAPVRRQRCLARHGRRAMVAGYRDLYRDILQEL